MRKFQVDDRVILNRGFGSSPSNPVWGEYAQNVVGTVIARDNTDIARDMFPVRVLWDNDTTNIYNDHHLSLYKPAPASFDY